MFVTAWMNQQQQQTTECLREENRILRAQLGTFAPLTTGVEAWQRRPGCSDESCWGHGNRCHARDLVS
jgi:hypothetical protein